jgi:hypothetical protein
MNDEFNLAPCCKVMKYINRAEWLNEDEKKVLSRLMLLVIDKRRKDKVNSKIIYFVDADPIRKQKYREAAL